MLSCGCAVVHVASTRLPLLLTHIYQNIVLEVGGWVYYRMNKGSKRQQGEEGGKGTGEGVGATGAGDVLCVTQTKEEEGKVCGCSKKDNVNKVEKEGRGGKEKGEEGEGEETVGEGQQGEAQAQHTHETQVHHKAAQVRGWRSWRKQRSVHVCIPRQLLSVHLVSEQLCLSLCASYPASPCVSLCVCLLGCGGGCEPCRAAATPRCTTKRTRAGTTHHPIDDTIHVYTYIKYII